MQFIETPCITNTRLVRRYRGSDMEIFVYNLSTCCCYLLPNQSRRSWLEEWRSFSHKMAISRRIWILNVSLIDLEQNTKRMCQAVICSVPSSYPSPIHCLYGYKSIERCCSICRFCCFSSCECLSTAETKARTCFDFMSHIYYLSVWLDIKRQPPSPPATINYNSTCF